MGKETLGLLSEAIAVLSKVQLIQKPEVRREALLQVRGIVHRVSPKFKNVMQKDLFDMLGEFKGLDEQKEKAFGRTLATGSFLGEVFLPKHEAAVLAQSREVLGDAQPHGAASGAKSHNSRSGGIVGLLNAQNDEFTKKLASAQKEEADALAAFRSLQEPRTRKSPQ